MKKIIIASSIFLMSMQSVCAQEHSETTGETNPDYICEGTKWVMLYRYFIPHIQNEVRAYNQWIEGTETINDKTYMKLWQDKWDDPSEHSLVAYIRKEGEKVYIINELTYENNERVLFDYAIQPGESQTFQATFDGDPMWEDMQLTATCIRCDVETNQGHSYEKKSVDFLIDGESHYPFIVPMRWIRGLGSDGGIANNMIFGESGGSSVYEVYHYDELVYKYQNSSIDDIEYEDEQPQAADLKFHLDGSIFKDGDTGICIQNGKKTIK